MKITALEKFQIKCLIVIQSKIAEGAILSDTDYKVRDELIGKFGSNPAQYL